jgi:hypothetical protein
LLLAVSKEVSIWLFGYLAIIWLLFVSYCVCELNDGEYYKQEQ